MSGLEEQAAHLEGAIAGLEAQRSVLGDALVEVSLNALRAQLDALLTQQKAAALTKSEMTPEEYLARLQSYLPKELAEKMLATGRIEGERKQVTVIFADLSGFTALSERLDPEEVTTLTNDALRAMAEAVYQYEGYIDKFVGDAVMAVFGAPIAHEDDAERALRTALAMRQRIEEFNRRWIDRIGEPISLHIGVNTGPVIAGSVGSDMLLSYTVMGDTVNTASRLEGAAQPGQTLVSRYTYRLTAEAFTFEALEPITVKGKREPLAVFELQRAKLHPGKSRGLKDLTSSFVGREREVAHLREVVRGLEAGRGRIVTLAGEAGIGKSRLMAEWRAEIGNRARWLEGRAFAHTTSLAYGPFLDLLRNYAGIKDEDSEAEAHTRLHNAVERLFPANTEAGAILTSMLGMRLSTEESDILAGFPAEAFRQRLFSLVEELFKRITREHPAVLVIEDMHWADATSMELLEHLLPLTLQVPLAIVGVFRLRPDETSSKLQALVEGRYAEHTTPIFLAPLSDTSSIEMVEQLLSTHELPDTLRAIIVGKAEGNPFFVEEVIRSLIERGALVRMESGEDWVATPLIETVSVPDTVQGLLMARLDRLPEETKWVAQQASVIGRVFLYRVLLLMAEHSWGVDADLSQLEREELIRERIHQPEVEYMFRHALTQEVAYQSLLSPRRKSLHRKVGEAMEALFAERLGEFHALLARHFLRGEAWEKAVDYLIKAGDAANRLYAHAEARLHYSAALQALEHVPDTIENRRCVIDTTTSFMSVSWIAEPPERNLARLAHVEPIARDLPSPDGGAGGDRLRLARVRYCMGRSHYMRNEIPQAISYYQQALAVGQEFGEEELVAIPSSVIGRALLVQGQFGKAGRLLTQATEPLEKIGNWPEWIANVGFLCMALSMGGHYAEGIVKGQSALARALALNNPTDIAGCNIFLSFAYLAGGDLGRMLETARLTVEAAEQAGDWIYVYTGHALSAWAESLLGNHEIAAENIAKSKEVAERLGGRQLILAEVFAAANAEIALNAERTQEALKLAQEAVAAATLTNSLYALGVAERVWGQALASLDPPRWGEIAAHMAASLDAFEAGEAHLMAARTHLAWGRICLGYSPTVAHDHLWKAAAQFELSGLAGELEQTRGLMEGLK
jgi:class 3 adenylate cyclase/tetratricopeptide (TPR) repeat protein